jgi:hypothetical protein
MPKQMSQACRAVAVDLQLSKKNWDTPSVPKFFKESWRSAASRAEAE